jgi:glycosyltransferase involved in cell wall biosynthesis
VHSFKPLDPVAPTGARVTVCFPTRNRSGYLREAIASVLAQTFTDFELIVSDNASTDDTEEVVASFGDPRIVYAPLDEDIGLVANHNRCLDLAATDYLMVLPDDDVLRPDMLESAVRVLDEHPRAGLVHSALDLIGPDGELVRAGATFMEPGAETTCEPGHEYIRKAFDTSIRVHVSTALFRRSALPSPRFDRRDFPPVDLAMMLRIGLDWDVCYIARPLAAVRLHRKSFSASNGGIYTDTGLIEEPEYIEKVKEIKLRFLAENADRLSGRDGLRRRAQRANTRHHANAISRRTWPERSRAKTLRLLLEAQRHDRGMVREAAAWRLLVGSLIGPRAVDLIRRRRSATPLTTSGVNT